MDDYLLSDEPIPNELILESKRVSEVNVLHRVYFDKDTGEIISISNEDLTEHDHFFDIETSLLEQVFGKTKDYKVTFDSEDRPLVILKTKEDVSTQFLMRVDTVDNWDNELTFEQYPLLKKWGCQLRADKREKFLKSGVNAKLEFFIVKPENKNFVLRTIEVNVPDLYRNDRIYFPFIYKNEEDSSLEIYTKKFFKTVGYRVLYDTNN